MPLAGPVGSWAAESWVWRWAVRPSGSSGPSDLERRAPGIGDRALSGVGGPGPPPLHFSHLNFLTVTPLGVLVAGWILGKHVEAVVSPAIGLHTDPFLGALVEPNKDRLHPNPHPLPPRCWSALVSELSGYQYSCSLTNMATNVSGYWCHRLLPSSINEAGHWT